jgi:acyl-CoA synthetase (AMP-forming)/AMP-acid ligase II
MPDERARLARRYAPDVLVVEQTADAAHFACAGARTITEAQVRRAITRAEHAANPSAPRFAEGRVCLTTSGSTGEPKGVMLDARQIAWCAQHIQSTHHLTPADRGLTVLPFSHVNAPVVSLCTSLLAGSTVVIAQRFSRSRFWSWIERYDITWASIVPTVLAMLLQTDRPDFLPGSLRFVRTASAPLPVVHHLAFERRFGVPVVETYGLSECASMIATNPVPPGKSKPGSVGLPAGVAMRICAPRSGPGTPPLCNLAPGQTGEVCVRGPSVIASYWGGGDAESFVDGWFRTGDLGYCDEDGYLFLTGRLRDVIIRGGENIAPREVEEVLLGAPGVRDVAIIGASDPIYGQRVVAHVVPSGAWTAASEAQLHEYCAARLSAHKVPERFVVVESLPRTRSGKLQRHVLSEQLREEISVG